MLVLIQHVTMVYVVSVLKLLYNLKVILFVHRLKVYVPTAKKQTNKQKNHEHSTQYDLAMTNICIVNTQYME